MSFADHQELIKDRESLQETLERADRITQGIARLQAEKWELREALQDLADHFDSVVCQCSAFECQADRAAIVQARKLLARGRP